MNNMKLGLSGHFELRVSGGARGELTLAEFDNLILDAGLNRLGTAAIGTHCQVGTGTAAPAVTDTTLQSLLAATTLLSNGTQTYTAGSPGYVSNSFTYRFATGVATGTLSEIGIGWATSGSLFSRALIVNGGGTPTPITILSDETLDVVYTLRAYIPADVTGSITLAGTAYNYTLRHSGVGASSPSIDSMVRYGMQLFGGGSGTLCYAGSGSLAAVTGQPPSLAGNPGTVTTPGYTNGSNKRRFTLNFALNQGNVGGAKCVWGTVQPANGVPAHSTWQCEFSTALPKDATKVLTLDFDITWSRV